MGHDCRWTLRLSLTPGWLAFGCVNCVADAAGTVPKPQQALVPGRGSQRARRSCGVQARAFCNPLSPQSSPRDRFPASLLQSGSGSILFWSRLPAGTKGKRWKQLMTLSCPPGHGLPSCLGSGLGGGVCSLRSGGPGRAQSSQQDETGPQAVLEDGSAGTGWAGRGRPGQRRQQIAGEEGSREAFGNRRTDRARQ